jgi:hypothetical protein
MSLVLSPNTIQPSLEKIRHELIGETGMEMNPCKKAELRARGMSSGEPRGVPEWAPELLSLGE